MPVQVLGVASMAGVAVMLLAMPLNWLITRNVRALQGQSMKTKDQRIKNTNDVRSSVPYDALLYLMMGWCMRINEN